MLEFFALGYEAGCCCLFYHNSRLTYFTFFTFFYLLAGTGVFTVLHAMRVFSRDFPTFLYIFISSLITVSLSLVYSCDWIWIDWSIYYIQMEQIGALLANSLLELYF